MNLGMKFVLSPLESTNLPFKKSDVGLLPGGAVLVSCAIFELAAFKSFDFSI
jgi:hypothetical protein